MPEDTPSWLREVQERLTKKAAQPESVPDLLTGALPSTPTPKAKPWAAFTDAVPDDGVAYERPEIEVKIDQTLEQLDVLTAYNRYCRKMIPVVGGKREGIMISCPKPDHADKNPSAWMNLDSDTWFCGGCQEGGDQYDIAAFSFGYDKTSYKEGKEWGSFRKRLAEDLGLVTEFIPGVGVVAPEVIPEAEAAPSPPVVEEQPALPTEPIKVMPGTLNWRAIAPAGTFLDLFMQAVIVDDVPEEYHFWHAMIGLGIVVGRDAYLFDQPEVYGNLFVCMLGSTGSGKSKSKRYLIQVMNEMHAWDADEDPPRGVKVTPTPASAEAMIRAFQHSVTRTGSTGTRYPELVPVRGLVEFPELKLLTGRAARQGSVIKETLIEFYDCQPQVASIAVSKDGERIAVRPSASVLTTVQPEVLPEVFKESDETGGFLNRWLFITGTRKPKQLFNRNTINLQPAVDALRAVHTWCKTPRAIVWAPSAEKVFKDAWDGYIAKDVASFEFAMGRIDLVIKKLGLILALNERSDHVTAEMVERVLLIYPYLLNTVKFRGDSMAISVESELDQDIMEVFNKFPTNSFSGQDVIRKLPRRGEGRGRDAGAQRTNRHLEELAKAGFLDRQTIKSPNGRTYIKYLLVKDVT